MRRIKVIQMINKREPTVRNSNIGFTQNGLDALETLKTKVVAHTGRCPSTAMIIDYLLINSKEWK
jgi:hypothetical protein